MHGAPSTERYVICSSAVLLLDYSWFNVHVHIYIYAYFTIDRTPYLQRFICNKLTCRK